MAEVSAMTRTIGFLLLDGFSLMSYASALEPLRAANGLAKSELYGWHNVTTRGERAMSSSGVDVRADYGLGDAPDLDILFVCAGGNPALFHDDRVTRWLRQLARKGTMLGALSGGAYILARAGLLDGYRATIHWEHGPAFREEFPDIHVERTLFVIDRNRLTCAGGVSALDLMHGLIAKDHGPALANLVSEWFLHTEVRTGSGPQRMSLQERHNVANPALLKALAEIERNIENPPSRADLARSAGISPRQLQRLFASHLGTTIGLYSQKVRLEHARRLLGQTSRSVMEVSIMCGYSNLSHFSRAYRLAFGLPPSRERRGNHA